MMLSPAPVPLDDHRSDGTGWAVVEIHRDGTLGRVELVTASGPVEAATLVRPSPDTVRAIGTSSDLHSHVGLLQAADGRLAEAARSFTRGTRDDPSSAGHRDCLGQLALVEAFQGDLHRSLAHAELALGAEGRNGGAQHARLAVAWVHFERAEHEECRRGLDHVQPPPGGRREAWLATSRLLLEARLLLATSRPDAASRLLAPVLQPLDGLLTGWASAVLTIARAESLLAAGEPRRALALLTPLPEEARVEASVVTAAGRHAIGDVRGATAVLAGVVSGLEGAPLALQVRAWLLEAWLAQERGKRERARLLVDRALHAAHAEDMRAPVLREWGRVRTLVDRDPALLRDHRELLIPLRASTAAKAPVPGQLLPSPAPPGDLLSAGLTERERQVLELLAEMYSTEEIARTLFVSGNTVKTHLKGIFGKLCVNRRVDAVRRGRQLGLC